MIRSILLPRPNAVRDKGEFFWIGIFIALPSVPTATISLIPVTEIALRALLYFFVLEILLQQAKFLWNDWRDREADAFLAGHDDRLDFTSVPYAPIVFPALIILRWLVALITALELSHQFFFLLVVISVHQIAYEYIFKPNTYRFPIVYLAFLSLNLPLRVLAGIFCILSMGGYFNGQMLIALFVFYLFSWSSLSTFLYLEAADATSADIRYRDPLAHGTDVMLDSLRRPKLRPHSQYFFENGRTLAYPALLLPVIISTGMVLLSRPQWANLHLDSLWACYLGLLAITYIANRPRSKHAPLLISKRVLSIVYICSFTVLTVLSYRIITDRASFWVSWFLLAYSNYHYLRFIDDPFLPEL